MVLVSPRQFRDNAKLQQAALNSPPLRYGNFGYHVALVQQGLIDLGYPMPLSTKKYGSPDGMYGGETIEKVRAFQRREQLSADGTVGNFTMHRLDIRLPQAGAQLAPIATAKTYVVPGIKQVIGQPTDNICWATVHCMMRSWKDQRLHQIRAAAERVDPMYAKMVDEDRGLPFDEFRTFINRAGMEHEPMASYPAHEWERMLREYGLLWIGTLNMLMPGAGLHSRIIEGISIKGEDNREMLMIDPAFGGIRYRETFEAFIRKYEGAANMVSGEYLQIRHF